LWVAGTSFRAGLEKGTFARMITLRECLEVMHSGAVFSLRVVTFDRRRAAKCGKIIEYPEASLVWGDGGNDRSRKAVAERAPTALERALSGMDDMDKRDPQHANWYTRNIRLHQQGAPTEAIKKIHPALIIEFNGEITCP